LRYVEHDPESIISTSAKAPAPAPDPSSPADQQRRPQGQPVVDKDRHIWLIDHGIFREDKLRTVIWDLTGGQPPCCWPIWAARRAAAAKQILQSCPTRRKENQHALPRQQPGGEAASQPHPTTPCPAPLEK
jgi:hypothetical protein